MSAELGRALIEAWGGRPQWRRKAPPATTPRAQLREMTRSERGRQLLIAGGVAPRSLAAWKSGSTPNPTSQTRIDRSYRIWFDTRPGRARRPAPEIPTGNRHAIHGQVLIGEDDRVRGFDGRFAPLRVEGGSNAVDWSQIIETWQRFHADPASPADPENDDLTWDALLAGQFIRYVIVPDIGVTSQGEHASFPGPTYEIKFEL